MPKNPRAIRIAAQLHPQHGEYRQLRATVDQVEEMGFDLLYTWDHFFPLYGEREGPHFECWSMLAAWAEQTSRLEIGALVTCNSYRNPDLLADMARTVDHISAGRLVFGIGSGWFRRDYDEYGYEFGTKRWRLDRLAESLPRMKARWEHLNPAPTRRLPVLVAGGGLRKTLRIVAEHADSWHGGFPERPEEMAPKVDALIRWCGEFGRDPTTIEWGLGIEPDDLDRFLLKDAATYVEMGFTQFTLGFNGPGWELGPGRDWVAWRRQVNGS